MGDWSTRRLTDGERALAGGVFEDDLDLSSVSLLQLPKLGFVAMVPIARTVVFSNWRAPLDFSKVGRGEQGWFIHELAHVWQAQRGVVLAVAKLRAIGLAAYRLQIRPGAPLSSYNIEQQAEIARRLFLARLEPRQAASASLEILEKVWPVRRRS